ncbi:MAG: STAS domain-containing protein [Planctomycetota bacterium]
MSFNHPPFDIRVLGCELVLLPTENALHGGQIGRSMTVEVDRLLLEPRPEMVTDVVVNMEQIHAITSVGLNELIYLKQRASRCGVGVKLRSVSDEVRQVIQITRLERIFELEENAMAPSASDDGTLDQ